MDVINLTDKKILASNEETVLFDLGDGIGCLEFRSKGNSISPRVREFIQELVSNGLDGLDGLVIGSQSKNFSVGADLFAIKNSIDNKQFVEFEKKIAAFQTMTRLLKSSAKPIVAAPYKMVLGGGLEVALHCHARVAFTKTFMGLVEAGVGLIPGGGGAKEAALRIGHTPKAQQDNELISTFEKILLKKISKDAADAKVLGYLKADDLVVEDNQELLLAAKEKCLELVLHGRDGVIEETVVLPGKAGFDKLIAHAQTLVSKGIISAYDIEIARRIAHVLAGSQNENDVFIRESQLLDIERNGFMELIQTKGTYDRIEHFLACGELLKN